MFSMIGAVVIKVFWMWYIKFVNVFSFVFRVLLRSSFCNQKNGMWKKLFVKRCCVTCIAPIVIVQDLLHDVIHLFFALYVTLHSLALHIKCHLHPFFNLYIIFSIWANKGFLSMLHCFIFACGRQRQFRLWGSPFLLAFTSLYRRCLPKTAYSVIKSNLIINFFFLNYSTWLYSGFFVKCLLLFDYNTHYYIIYVFKYLLKG